MKGCKSKFNEIRSYVEELAHIDNEGICTLIKYETKLKDYL